MQKDKILENLLINFFGSTFESEMREVTKTDNSYIIELPIPGIKKEEVDIKVNDKILLIKSNNDNKYIGKINKKYILPDYIDFDSIKANIELGILTIDLPFKISKLKEKKIEII